MIEPIRLPDRPETPYPDDIPGFLRGKGLEVLVFPALRVALELGEKRCANVILLGLLSTRLELADGSWRAALAKRFPEKLFELNLRAFARGRDALAASERR